jgi:uncharacterized protein (TIGR02145 family)
MVRLYHLPLLFFLLLPGSLFAQLSVTEGSALGMTPLELVQNMLVGKGVTVSNATFNGSSAPITSVQIGSFTATGGAFQQLKLDAGIILSSGKASYAIGPNSMCGQSYNAAVGGDPDLTIIADTNTEDKSVLEFDFIPQSDTLKFRYEFGSEELFTFYLEFNDAFGFILSGPGISGPFSNNGVNIAIMPGTSNYVTINNICEDPSVCWCNSPLSCPSSHDPPSFATCTNPLGNGVYLQYNAFTYVLTAWHVVVPCETYHIKLGVADAWDHALDSGVFLEKNSFTSENLDVTNTYTMPELGQGAMEGCSDARVRFKLTHTATQNDTIQLIKSGTALEGTDYTPIPNSVIIPTGQDSAQVIIHPLMDGITEGTETVILNIQTPLCSGVSTTADTILIFDYPVMSVNAGNDTSICAGIPVTLTAQRTGGISPYQYLWSTGGTSATVTVNPPAGVNHYWAKVTDHCTQGATDTVTIVGWQGPAITNTVRIDTVCSGTPVQFSLTSDVAGTVFTWRAFGSDATVTGYTDGIGSTISQVLSNSGINIDTVLYVVTPSQGTCYGNPVSFRALVYPVPGVTCTPVAQEICSGARAVVQLVSQVAGTTFTWTASASSPDVSGFSPGSGSLVSQYLFNTGNSPGTVTYQFIPALRQCTGIPADASAVVDPLPVVSVVTCTDNITSSNAKPFLLRGGTPPGGTWSGPGVNSSTGIFTPSAAGTGNKLITYTYTNTWLCAAAGTKTITVNATPAFTCNNIFRDIRDNHNYKTVKIGTQCWLAENLAYGAQLGSAQTQRDNCIAEKYCYQDISTNCALYGGLYQWDEMMQYDDAAASQGFCPPGWHVPTESDWTSLFSNFVNNGFAASPLKYTGYTDFNALLGGMYDENAAWRYASFAAMYWSSITAGPVRAWAHGMNTPDPSVSFYPALKDNAFYVRCVKD